MYTVYADRVSRMDLFHRLRWHIWEWIPLFRPNSVGRVCQVNLESSIPNINLTFANIRTCNIPETITRAPLVTFFRRSRNVWKFSTNVGISIFGIFLYEVDVFLRFEVFAHFFSQCYIFASKRLEQMIISRLVETSIHAPLDKPGQFIVNSEKYEKLYHIFWSILVRRYENWPLRKSIKIVRFLSRYRNKFVAHSLRKTLDTWEVETKKNRKKRLICNKSQWLIHRLNQCSV